MPDAARRPVLVIEDDESSAEMLIELLLAEGYAATSVATAADALAALASDAYSAAFLDLTLPGLSSEQLVRAVAALPSCPPLIVFSARPKSEVVSAGRALGAIVALQKPAELDALLDAVRAAVDRPAPIAATVAAPERPSAV